ncbi:MAG: type I DNA topoisomerase [Tissierellaceae bacterium]|nr:type I DNA topoisomerase [Tissierellaceae bacterium]
MAKNLVIVESPAKAKTIGKFLGRSYKVVASVGHVRDLPKSKLGIDIENSYEPNYITIRGKGPVISELKKEAKKVDKIYLATDPDREGEAIAWHLAHILNIDLDDNVRVEFNEITKDAIKKAIKSPRKLDQDLIDAQQARRILDRLVGYKISPLLWKKIKKGLSAGRVQSVACKLICDREDEINSFIPEEYWSLNVLLNKDKDEFEANFIGKYIDKKEEKVNLKNKHEVDDVINSINRDRFVVDEIKRGVRRRNPYAPYTTSTMQQDASKKLGFTTKKTMIVAQQLYEGTDIKGEGTVGLITYMRTDSTRVSKEAVDAAKEYIIENYGKEYSNGGKDYSKKSKKNSQDAHEAIRPTGIFRDPKQIESSLTKDQYKLYKLIWDRFIGSQMSPAKYDTLSVNILSNDNLFRTTGSILVFPGFLKVYITVDEEEKDKKLPNLAEGDTLKLIDVLPKQHFTQPPSRYSESSLIKTMEELGIGRPSTYAPTISTILARDYVYLEKKLFYPTELGVLVNDLLKEYFNNIVNEEFTADLEDKLDEIADGDLAWRSVVDNFYGDFKDVLSKAEEEIDKIEIQDEVTDEICEKCGRNMVIKMGRFGKFLACPGYPECKNTKALLDKINVKCPSCDTGEVVRKRSKKGRVFFGCTNYPECEFVSWNEPVEEKCPKCGEYMILKRSKKGNSISCTNKECGYVKTNIN